MTNDGSKGLLVAAAACVAVLAGLGWYLMQEEASLRDRSSRGDRDRTERGTADEVSSGGGLGRGSGREKGSEAGEERGRQAGEKSGGTYGEGSEPVIAGGQRADPGPAPEDSERSDAYPYARKKEDCSRHEKKTNQAKALARQVDESIIKASKMTLEDEERMGEEMWAELARQKGSSLRSDGPTVEYLNGIAAKLTPHLQRKSIQYEFHVVDDDSLNAFACPGGHIVFHTGLLRKLDNEAQLAAVMGHELAHNDLKHCISNLMLAKEILGKVNDLTLTLMWFLRLPVSTEQELEADRTGMELAMTGGYSPFQAVAFMEMLPPHEKWSEASQDFRISLGNPMLDAILRELERQFLDEIQNMVDTHPNPPARACYLKQRIFDKLSSEAARWFFLGKRTYGAMRQTASL